MKVQTISKYFLGAILSVGLFSACSEDTMDKINGNPDNVKDVKAKYILTDVMTSTAFSQVGGDMNGYLSTYVEHEAGSHNQFHRAEMRNGEPSSSSTFNNVWASAYEVVKNAKIAVAKCSEGGAEDGNDVTLGISQVMLAYNIAFLTDMFGDTPWKETGDYFVSMIPAIDKQEDIYKDIMTLIDNAIVNLDGDDEWEDIGEQDFIYKGRKADWKKAAYGLKARYLMRLTNRTATLDTDMEEILKCIDKSFTSAEDQFSFNIYTGINMNPMYGIFASRKALAASMSLYNKLAERNDPRMNNCFFTGTNTSTIVATFVKGADVKLAENGNVTEGQMNNYSNSIFVASRSASTHLMSYHELLFLKAEALERLERTPEAKTALKDAVIAGIQNTQESIDAALAVTAGWDFKNKPADKMDVTVATTYFDMEVSPLFDADPLKEIMIQKYLALWGANGETVETYNDVRRLNAEGKDFYDLQNPKGMPLRCPYGVGDTSANPNVSAAYGNGQYVYSENVWWAGGTR